MYWRLTLRCTSSPSTFRPSATSRSLPLTTIFINKTAASPRWVRPFYGSPCSLRWNYPVQVRGVPGRTRFSGNLPPRRQPEYTTASDERELASRLGHHPRQRALDPLGSGGQHDRRRADVKRFGIAPRRRGAAVAQGARGVHETAANVDDGGVAGAQVLERAIDDVALALLDGLILDAEAG